MAGYAEWLTLIVSMPSCFLFESTLTPALPLPCHVRERAASVYPRTLRTLGEHLRTRRLELGLLHCEVADRLGVDRSTVTNRELNRTSPALRFLPRVLTNPNRDL